MCGCVWVCVCVNRSDSISGLHQWPLVFCSTNTHFDRSAAPPAERPSCVCVCVCVYVCVCVCVCPLVLTCPFMCLSHLQMNFNEPAHTHTHTLTHAHTHARTHICTRTHTQTHTLTRTQATLTPQMDLLIKYK